jgi:hypothetical protein
MGDELRITGLVETQKMIRDVSTEVARSLPQALIAAGVVIQGELLKNAPQRQEGHDEKSRFPALRSSLITDIEISADGKVGLASTGFGDAGPVALWNEYGHRIVSHKGVDSGKKTLPNPFMRRSIEACADAAIDAFAEAIGVAVRKT